MTDYWELGVVAPSQFPDSYSKIDYDLRANGQVAVGRQILQDTSLSRTRLRTRQESIERAAKAARDVRIGDMLRASSIGQESASVGKTADSSRDTAALRNDNFG